MCRPPTCLVVQTAGPALPFVQPAENLCSSIGNTALQPAQPTTPVLAMVFFFKIKKTTFFASILKIQALVPPPSMTLTLTLIPES